MNKDNGILRDYIKKNTILPILVTITQQIDSYKTKQFFD